MENNTYKTIIDLYNNTVWTHKIQEKESDLLHKRHINLNTISIILLALTTSGIFSAIFVNAQILKITSTFFSFLSLVFNIIILTRNYEVLSQQHKSSALDFLCLRNDLQVFISDIKIERYSKKNILKKRDGFFERYNLLCKNSFSASSKAVKLAEKEVREYLIHE